jgi:hypothetical protein
MNVPFLLTGRADRQAKRGPLVTRQGAVIIGSIISGAVNNSPGG